ncbi:molybdenum cofactor guanylyltransferase [Maricaulis sp.]|uniref:molybdenum cofactor guanylyltransferase n=1 Tax=Maricaulis sp. TaxID=1486257 RepID=UPI00262158B8|nr:molybdenum cofactor guanylyltransferase [Maricaulis sp.]
MSEHANSDLVGLILAGGQSRRMGRDKAALDWRGQSLLERARTCLQAAGCSTVHVLGPDGSLPDRRTGCGPAHALYDAMNTLNTKRAFLALPVDMPRLEPSDLTALVGAQRARAYRDHPLPAFFPARLHSKFEPPEHFSMRMLLEAYEVDWIDTDPSRTDHFANINTPEDFAALDKTLN